MWSTRCVSRMECCCSQSCKMIWRGNTSLRCLLRCHQLWLKLQWYALIHHDWATALYFHWKTEGMLHFFTVKSYRVTVVLIELRNSDISQLCLTVAVLEAIFYCCFIEKQTFSSHCILTSGWFLRTTDSFGYSTADAGRASGASPGLKSPTPLVT